MEPFPTSERGARLGAEFAATAAAARAVVSTHLPPTPLVSCDRGRLGDQALLKLETLQPTGSFKVRGALSAATVYGVDGSRIVTASAGNHGLGVAYAARRLGQPATVVVPSSTPAPKLEGLRELGVDLRIEDGGYDAAEAAAIRLAGATGGRFVSAYSDAQVIAGQSTMLFEVADVLTEPFQIVVPVGGGGLAAGVALAARSLDRDITLVGVEARSSMAVSTAVRAGRVTRVEVGDTLADGLAGNLDPTAVTPELIGSERVTLTSVSEEEIRAAIGYLARFHGVVAEGSAAVGVAAALAGRIVADRPTVFVITGRNIALDRFAAIVAAGPYAPTG